MYRIDDRPLPQLLPSEPGFYARHRSRGFVVHFNASPARMCRLRKLTTTALSQLGLAAEPAENALLVISELAGNSIRACGDHVPLVVEVNVAAFGVAVNVHDPEPGRMPLRSAADLDDPEAESGRGLGLVDLLAPGWHVVRSPIGKQIRCRVPVPGS
ncbi:ATP-binding protein [Streptomyces sp. MAR4 CNX-425]|uniref:ATP-binding protein n=1 Tax=Streptomyces sp. MAR4 CNX-425 TaxID=3406343 RepID=UPI003B51253E